MNRFRQGLSAAIVLCGSIGLTGCTSHTYPDSASPTPGSTFGSSQKWVDTCGDWDDWDKPGPPFRLFGNSYYVGSCGIATILIVGDEGHILIDGGTEKGAQLIAKNINDLGFSIRDVKILLHSHEHFDHVAGLAELQKLSGAKLLASPEAASALRTGIAADSDPQAGIHDPFPASQVDGIVRDGEAVILGDLRLIPVATPGHTAGALSWQWQSCESSRCLSMVYADSLSPISSDHYHFSDHPRFLAAYRAGLDKLAALDCHILITPHPSASQLRHRLSSGEGLIDAKGCRVYAHTISERLKSRLIEERHPTADKQP